MSDLTEFLETPKFTLSEWEIIIASYAYEVEAKSIMDDGVFDLLCEQIPEPSNIPDFSPGTGMWVQDVIKITGHEFLKGCTKKLRAIGKYASITHIKFPEGWLDPIPPWSMPTYFDHIPQEGLPK